MINNFIKLGFEDICVLRIIIKWGIEVLFDLKYVIYVWIDVFLNYIMVFGYMLEDDSRFKKYWLVDVYFVGKEIVRFYIIIWLVMLMVFGFLFFKIVFGYGWLFLEGGKMLKFKGNVVDFVVFV